MKKELLTLLLIVFFASAFGQQTTDKQNPFPKTITVTGSAEMEIVPDEIYVVVDLREYDKRGQGKIDIERIKSAFVQNCREIGLIDSAITIASYQGYNNPWLRKKKKADLYSTISYQVKFSKSNDMDRLVDRLDDDATQNFRIIRTAHSRINEFRKQLKIQAIKAAKDKGIYLSEAIGEKLGDAISILEPEENSAAYYNNLTRGENSQIYLRDSMKLSYGMGDNAEIPVDFKKIKLRFEINVVFALK